jgi:hypothetical protein
MSKQPKKFPLSKLDSKKSLTFKVVQKKGAADSSFLTHDLNNLITAEIIGSGLKIGSGFHQALANYARVYKVKGKQAARVKAYLAKAAINIAKNDTGIFSGGVKPKFVYPHHLQAGAYLFHLPRFLNDRCSSAIPQIEHLEKTRPKGAIGQLSPILIKYLDELK